jgi:hypothetical protein
MPEPIFMVFATLSGAIISFEILRRTKISDETKSGLVAIGTLASLVLPPIVMAIVMDRLGIWDLAFFIVPALIGICGWYVIPGWMFPSSPDSESDTKSRIKTYDWVMITEPVDRPHPSGDRQLAVGDIIRVGIVDSNGNVHYTYRCLAYHSDTWINLGETLPRDKIRKAGLLERIDIKSMISPTLKAAGAVTIVLSALTAAILNKETLMHAAQQLLSDPLLRDSARYLIALACGLAGFNLIWLTARGVFRGLAAAVDRHRRIKDEGDARWRAIVDQAKEESRKDAAEQAARLAKLRQEKRDRKAQKRKSRQDKEDRRLESLTEVIGGKMGQVVAQSIREVSVGRGEVPGPQSSAIRMASTSSCPVDTNDQISRLRGCSVVLSEKTEDIKPGGWVLFVETPLSNCFIADHDGSRYIRRWDIVLVNSVHEDKFNYIVGDGKKCWAYMSHVRAIKCVV